MPDRNLLSLRWSEADKISRASLFDALRSLAGFEAGAVLDVGAGEHGYRELFGARSTRFVALDVDLAAGPAVVGSALALPFRPQTFDTVVCTQTLEHLPDPVLALAEMKRVLRVGGRLLLTAPQSWPMHLVPHDYYRYTRHGLEWLCQRAGLAIERIEPCGGAIATVGQLLALGAFHMGTHARHSRIRHFWRRALLPLINRLFLRLDRRFPMTRTSVLNWVVLARRL